MKRVYSGIQPSGALHLGNYLGAIKNWVDLQNQYDCIYSIADYHAITIPYDIKTMSERILTMAVSLLASGLDPQKCTLYVQSHVVEHTELAWIFSTITPLGLLERMTQFKDKSSQHEHNINLGLFAYPVLQTVDILLYKSDFVPVGEDQQQHLELTRDLARKFNYHFGEFFPEPQILLTKVKRLMGLDGTSKMSKSKNNTIELLAKEKETQQKIMQAVTDPQRVKRTDAGNPNICPIYSIHQSVSDKETQDEIYEGCTSAGIGCVDCKKKLIKNLEDLFAPIRNKAQEFLQHKDYVYDVLKEGQQRCTKIASENMEIIRKKIGLRSY